MGLRFSTFFTTTRTGTTSFIKIFITYTLSILIMYFPEELTPQRRLGVSDRDLNDLMDSNLTTFHLKLQNFGGVDGLCTQISIHRENNIESPLSQNPNPNPTDGVPSLIPLIWSRLKSQDLRLLRIQFYLQMTPYLIARLFQFMLGFGVNDDEEEYYSQVEVSPWVRVQTGLTYIYICLPLCVSAFLHGWTNYKVKTAFLDRDFQTGTSTLTVTRDGVTHEKFLTSDLVIGDICILSPGTRAPADGVWVESLNRPDMDPRVFYGGFIRNGGKMLVLAVGQNTVMARSATLAAADVIPQDGPAILNRKITIGDKLNSFSISAIKIGIVIALLTTLFILARFYIEKYMIERQVWAMVHAQRFISFVIFGVLTLSKTLPDLVPLALIISLEVTRHRLTRVGAVFLKTMDALTTFASATTILTEKKCMDDTTTTPSHVAHAIRLFRRLGMIVRILVPSDGTELDLNFGKALALTKSDVCVLDSRAHSSSVGIIRSLSDSEEIVALVSTGEDPQALQAAHVGIVAENGRPYIGTCNIKIRDENEFHVLGSLLGSGRRVFEDMDFVLQFYIPVLVVLCLTEVLEKCVFSTTNLTVSQMRCVIALVYCITIGHIFSPDSEFKPQMATYGDSSLKFTARAMMKNIAGQILYQMAVVVCILFLSIDRPPDSSSLILVNAIVWMTRYNGLNARKGHGEMNVFEGLSLTHPFLWTWIIFAICHVGLVAYVDLTSDWFPLTRDEWVICCVAGVGSLIWYQVCRLIPIGRGEFVETRRPTPLTIPYTITTTSV